MSYKEPSGTLAVLFFDKNYNYILAKFGKAVTCIHAGNIGYTYYLHFLLKANKYSKLQLHPRR